MPGFLFLRVVALSNLDPSFKPGWFPRLVDGYIWFLGCGVAYGHSGIAQHSPWYDYRATGAKVLSLWHRHTMGSKQAPGGTTHVTHGGLTASQRSQGLFFQGGLSPQGWARAAACLWWAGIASKTLAGIVVKYGKNPRIALWLWHLSVLQVCKAWRLANESHTPQQNMDWILQKSLDNIVNPVSF